MRELTYAAMLVFVLVATLPLEILLRTRVYARLRRLALVLVCAGLPFVVWDLLAVRAGHWFFDTSQTLGLELAGLPLEEVLFFVVVPLASVMTLEAVRSVRGWTVGDEPQQPAGDTVEGEAT
ncbi:lycopene cyclase domain-containing protein [Nocardioides dongxiaopingii]|uniref:lycopene cyclase domain-containing protein n=1 Tax=Nocardioides sp. S-1144 TaxID=2582905 RepID=UPI00110E7A92|nr:lycopene cyclase domain-containing protein [Nocardioides sp. S-1144]QCW51591.1 lycopene cyclase domain-containing protein [Nocardioides sp. S-1144]